MQRGRRIYRIPQNHTVTISKQRVLEKIQEIDNDPMATQHVLAMETAFRRKMEVMSDNMPTNSTSFERLRTNPYVLLALAFHRNYSRVVQLEESLIASKAFSSFETSLGKNIEEVVLPVYGWRVVPSQSQTPYSILDGMNVSGGHGKFATLKSGPQCINDDQVAGLSSKFVDNYRTWAADHQISNMDFVIGILYGTYSRSNKKDWHILEQSALKVTSRGGTVVSTPDRRWDCSISEGSYNVAMSVKIGVDFWSYIGGSDRTYLEVCLSLIRACVAPTSHAGPQPHTIHGINEIVSTSVVPEGFNVSIIQRSQLEWVFLMVSHFCDRLV